MPKRDAEHMEAQRRRILRAALRCMGERGIERTSVAEIRREAGLSAGALYTHFRSKEEIIAAALRFGGAVDNALPDAWPALVAHTVELEGGDGDFDAATIARTQLQIMAGAIRPGPLHQLFKPMIEQSLEAVAAQLEAMQRKKRVKLRLSPLRTALAIAALKDGVVWLALARDQPIEEAIADLTAALACLVEP